MINEFILSLILFIFINIYDLSSNESSNPIICNPTNIAASDTVILEENSEVVLSSIKQSDIDETGNKLIITDRGGRYAVLYNLRNGKIIRNIAPGPDLSDSIALNYNPQYEYFCYYLSNKSAMEYAKRDSTFLKNLSNRLEGCKFINDSIIIFSGYFNIFMHKTNSEGQLSLGLDCVTLLLYYNINNKQFFNILKTINNKYISAQTIPYLIDT